MNNIQIQTIGLLILMIYLQIGKKQVKPLRFLIPIIAVGYFGMKYMKPVHVTGVNLNILVGVVIAGAIFGLLLVLFTSVVRNNDTFYTVAGIPYAIILIISIGSRSVISYYAQNNPVSFGQFLAKHQIDPNIIAPAFIYMVIALLLVRTVGVLIKVNNIKKKANVV